MSFLLVHILLWSEVREYDRMVWKLGPLERELNHGLSPRPVSLSNPPSDLTGPSRTLSQNSKAVVDLGEGT